MRNWFAEWWACRQRLLGLDANFRAAGLQRRDPFYPLFREMAVLPDRLLRWLIVQVLILLVVVIGPLVWHSDSYPIFQRFAGTTRDSQIVVINAPGGLRWVNCLPGKYCLEVFIQPVRKP